MNGKSRRKKYIILSGSGNPNDEIFSDKVATLFSIAYKIKMAYKTLAEKSNETTDYTVYPLEGIWSTASEKGYLVKEELQYRIMIRQPDFITREIQVLHKGAFDDEPTSFEIMDRYCMEHGYRRMGKEHREIYLNNANRTEANLKTILRYKVTDIENILLEKKGK